MREVDPRALVRRAVAMAAPHGGGGPCLGGEARQPRPGAAWGRQRAAMREGWLGPGQCIAGWQCYAVTFNSELGKVTQIALQRDLDSWVDAQEMPAAIIAVWNADQDPIINHSVNKPETRRGRHTGNDTGA